MRSDRCRIAQPKSLTATSNPVTVISPARSLERVDEDLIVDGRSERLFKAEWQKGLFG
jgi:hypothetical protein